MHAEDGGGPGGKEGEEKDQAGPASKPGSASAPAAFVASDVGGRRYSAADLLSFASSFRLLGNSLSLGNVLQHKAVTSSSSSMLAPFGYAVLRGDVFDRYNLAAESFTTKFSMFVGDGTGECSVEDLSFNLGDLYSVRTAGSGKGVAQGLSVRFDATVDGRDVLMTVMHDNQVRWGGMMMVDMR
jgi:hypothetical protein